MIWLAFFACLLVSFLFSGIESGVLSVNRVRLRHYARRGEEAAQKLDTLLERVERLMTTVVLITNAANIVAVTLLYSQLTRWMGPLGAVVTLVILLPIFVLGLEFLPKAIFRRFPYRTLVIFARMLTAAHWLLAPVVNLGAWALGPFFRGGREDESGRIVTVEDFKRHIALAESRGQRTSAERAMLDHVVDFRALRARDVMQPLEKVPQLPSETPIGELLRKAAETDESRFLVREADGEVSGMVRVLDLLLDGVNTGRVQSYVRRVVMVGADEQALEALTKLRAARLPLAVVTDAQGRPEGVLTSEDLVRRLLGGGK
jgi:CBS domain containing-hemolysin-like protein